MTGAQAKAKARREVHRLVDEQEAEEIENAELNLVPYLDIVNNTLMFLLATISMALPMVQLNVTQPPVAPPGEAGSSAADQGKKLNLSVAITREGFTMLASTGTISIAANPDGSLDYAALRKNATEIKQRFPEEFKFNLTANPGIPYWELVATMDAMRGDSADPAQQLFPDVAFATDIH